MYMFRLTLVGLLAVVAAAVVRGQSGSTDERKYFHLVSQLNGLVMDILNRDRFPGAHVIMWPRKIESRSNQVWYTEESGFLRSQMNGLCLDVASDGYAVMNHCHEEAPMQKWGFSGEKLQNSRNRSIVLDISFYNRNKAARVAAWTYHGGMNQHWFKDDPYV